MGDRPILFSAAMVRALLAGTKTQTRRAIKLPTKGEYVRPDMGGWAPTTSGGKGTRLRNGDPAPEMVAIWNQTTGTTICMNYQPGDRLWVREAWRTSSWDDHWAPSELSPSTTAWRYEADGLASHDDITSFGRLRASMHMPRWASRLTLIVTDVRVQRLQDISEDDARAEGCDQALADAIMEPEELAVFAATHILAPHARARIIFETLWEQINGADSWAANPWVVAYTFTVHQQNIDALPLPAARDAAMREGG